MSTQNAMLAESIENLHVVFAHYPLRHLMDCCPHCISDDDLAVLQSAPLRELSADSLESFSVKAMSTWGDIDDFRHFLSRLLELVVQEGELDFITLTSKLNYGDWRAWPTEEQQAIEQFLMALWQAILGATPYWSRRSKTSGPRLPVEDFLDAVVPLGSIEPYIAYWKSDDTLPALQNLADFVMGEGSSLLMALNRRHTLSPTEQEELRLLSQPWVRERLEAAFFAPPPGYSDTELSLVVSRLDWLRLARFGH